MSSWGERAQIKELREEINRLRGALFEIVEMDDYGQVCDARLTRCFKLAQAALELDKQTSAC